MTLKDKSHHSPVNEFSSHYSFIWLWWPFLNMTTTFNSPDCYTALREGDYKITETLPGTICNLCQRSDPLYYLQYHHRSKVILVIMALLFWRPLSKGCYDLAGISSMTLTIHGSFIHLLYCHQQHEEDLKLFTVIGAILSFSTLNLNWISLAVWQRQVRATNSGWSEISYTDLTNPSDA